MLTWGNQNILRRTSIVLNLALLISGALEFGSSRASAASSVPPPKSVRLYVFDCGTIHAKSADGFSLKKEEVASTEMSVPCFLIAHAKGTMLWDAGLIPDRPIRSDGASPAKTPDKPLLPQLAAVGYKPAAHPHVIGSSTEVTHLISDSR